MSIQSEIDRITNNVQTTLSTIADTGVAVPANANSDNLPAAAAALANEKLDKLAVEYNKIINFGSTGLLYVGKFGVYDTQVTVDITSTTSVTYSGKLVIATQNYVIKQATVYGDAANTITPNIFIKPSTTSDRFIEVYFKPSTYSKNVVHIYGSAIASVANVGTSVTSVPSTATVKPTNALTAKFSAIGHTHSEYALKTDITADTNTTYSLSKSGSTIALKGSDGTKTSVVVAEYYVYQQEKTTNNNYPLLLAEAAVNNGMDGVPSYTYRNDNIYANPSTGAITATSFVGNLTGTASQATADGNGNNIASTYLPLSGGTMNQKATIKWTAMNGKNPYIGYCSASTDGTFMVGSIAGTSYTTGLAIGGSSGNLLWKGARILTANDTAAKATADGNGNNIANTYVTKANLITEVLAGLPQAEGVGF